MLPFIQCHQTRGRAPLGGFSNPLLSGSAAAGAEAAAGAFGAAEAAGGVWAQAEPKANSVAKLPVVNFKVWSFMEIPFSLNRLRQACDSLQGLPEQGRKTQSDSIF
jgi:hypothetical protein